MLHDNRGMVSRGLAAYPAATIRSRTVREGAPHVIIEQGTPVTTPAARRPRLTMVVVAAVAMLAIAIGAVAGAFLVGGRGAGAGAGAAAAYVPADALMYMEVRLDLPGDQRQMLRQVLDRFEPIDTDTVLGEGLATWFDDAMKSSDPRLTYSKDVAPWFTGETAFALIDYPAMADQANMKLPNMVAFLGVRDRAAARSAADRLRGELEAQGSRFTSEMHDGTEVWSLVVDGPAPDGMTMMSPGFAYAVTADQLLIGPGKDSLARALDVHAGASSSLAQREELRTLASRLPADRVALLTTDSTTMLKQLRADVSATNPEVAGLLDTMAASVPPFAVGAARFEADRLTFDLVSAAPKGAYALENRDRNLARWAPSDAIFFADGPNLGRSLSQMTAGLKSAMGVGATKERLDQVQSALGGDLESFVDWIGDGAVVAGWDGAQPYGGLILVPTDPDVARQRLSQLTALAKLAAGQAGMKLSVSDETVAGVTVTTFRYQQDAASEGFGLPGVAVQYAVTDERVIIGFGDRFVGRVLGLQESGSLAASERYRSAMATVGGLNNAAGSYLDLKALREAVETAIPATERATYEREILPYLEPFDYLVGATRLDGDVATLRSAVVVR